MYMKSVQLFKALADETRLRLVHLSLHYELNVNEIVAIMGMGQSRISRHLKILTDNRLLTFRRDGLWTFYSGVNEGEGYRFIQSWRYIFENEDLLKEDLEAAGRIIEERKRETVRFFDAIAEDWEKLKREIIGEIDLDGIILKALPGVDTVVDLGCGTGDLLGVLSRVCRRVIGVDRSPRMLASARRQYPGENQEVEFRLGELEHLPLREGEADLALVSMVLHHLPEPLKAIQEAYRVLKPGSSFIIVDLLHHQQERMRERYGDRWLGFSVADIEKWLDSVGFKIDKIDYFDLKKNLRGFLVQSTRQSSG